MAVENSQFISVLIRENTKFRIHRVQNTVNGTSVIVKSTRSAQPGRYEIAQLRNEYQILQEIAGVEGVPQVVSLEVETHSCTMVLENFEGESLLDIIRLGPFSIPTFFQISIQILETLGRLHLKNIVHCDLTPQNILIEVKSKKTQIIDFGLSRRLVGRGQFQTNVEGATLAYVAPEQTGRVNRRVDHRTDFYALGIGFYEMLCGRVPFEGHDALEWIHAHIAKKAIALQEINPGIPIMLSRIVEKMMSKAAEDRYQSVDGLISDVVKTQGLVNSGTPQEEFSLGDNDRSGRFMLSQKLVGRQKQLETLNRLWENSFTDGNLAMISGAGGSGKTSLIREFAKIHESREGLFVQGKFDSRQIDIPLSGVTMALNDMVQQILTWPIERQAPLVERIKTELSARLEVLLPVVPNLTNLLNQHETAGAGQISELLAVVGTVTETNVNNVVELRSGPAGEKQEKNSSSESAVGTREETLAWQRASVRSLMEVVLEFSKPMTFFLDDIQYMDETSATLFSMVPQRQLPVGLLFVFSFRDEEESATSGFKNLWEGFRANPSASNHLLDLQDLSKTDIADFVSDTLKMPRVEVRELSDVLHQKTGGNPLFVNQIFKSLADENLLSVRPEVGWHWNIKEIEARETPKSVVDLLAEKIRLLPLEVREILAAASCFSKSFYLSDLSAISAKSEAENREHLLKASDGGLIFPETELRFRFIHERVREAIYLSIPENEVREIHGKLALHLLRDLNNESPREIIFDALSHASLGLDFIENHEQRARIARFSLDAARMARSAAVFELSLKLATGGINASSHMGWEAEGDFLFRIHILKAEMEFILGQRDFANKTFSELNTRLTSDLQRGILASVRMNLLVSIGAHQEIVDIGLKTLSMLGRNLSLNPSKLGILRNNLALRTLMRFRGMPPIRAQADSDPRKGLEKTLILTITQSAYFVNKPLFAANVISGCIRSYFKDTDSASGVDLAFFGVYLAKNYGMNLKALELVDFVMSIPKTDLPKRVQTLIAYVRAAFLAPFTKSWSETISLLEEIFTKSLRSGDFANSGFSALYLAYYYIYSGESLDDLDEKIKKNCLR